VNAGPSPQDWSQGGVAADLFECSWIYRCRQARDEWGGGVAECCMVRQVLAPEGSRVGWHGFCGLEAMKAGDMVHCTAAQSLCATLA